MGTKPVSEGEGAEEWANLNLALQDSDEGTKSPWYRKKNLPESTDFLPEAYQWRSQ